MPPPESNLILEWKRRYKDIFSVTVGRVEYIFRALTFREYDDLTADDTSSMADIEELVIAIAVLWPESINLDRIKAGHVTSIADEIIDISGFSSIQNARTILEQKREEAMSFRFNMKAFVLATHHNTTEEELDDLTFSQLAAKVAMAERIIAVQQAVLGRKESGVQLDIVDPEEIAAEEQAQRARDKEVQDREFRKLSGDRYAGAGDGDGGGSRAGTAKVGDPIAEKLKAALGG